MCVYVGVLLFVQVKGVRGAVIGVGAGRFHSAFATEVAMYTCGEDHGQLGEGTIGSC